MEAIGEEKFVTDRHATIGDAAQRRVAERDVTVHHPVEQVSPLMRGVLIGRRTSVVMILVFLLLTVVPGAWALLAQLSPGSLLRQKLSKRGSPATFKTLINTSLEDSPPNRWMRRTWEASLSGLDDRLGYVLLGKDGFLFYAPDFDACVGKPIFAAGNPDVVSNIVEYNNALRSRGIHLVVLPVPTKTSILPWKIDPNYPLSAGPACNPDHRRWVSTLQSNGVDVVDLTDEFWNLATSGTLPYQAQDTHWTLDATAVAAKRLVGHVAPWLGNEPHKQYATRTRTTSIPSDLVQLMRLDDDIKHWPPIPMVETQVLIDGKPAEDIGRLNRACARG